MCSRWSIRCWRSAAASCSASRPALAAWAAFASLSRALPWTTAWAFVFNVVVLAACLAIGNRLRHARMPLVTRRWYDIPLRACMVALLVATVVGLSAHVGPTITGMLAVFPIVLLSLMLILHPRIGGPATGAVLSNSMLGLVGFSLTCLTARLVVVPLGTAAGLRIGARGLDRLQSCVLVAAARQAAAGAYASSPPSA